MLSNLPLKRLFQFGASEQHMRATVSISRKGIPVIFSFTL